MSETIILRITRLLNTLEEPYRSLAIKNIDEEYVNTHGLVSHSDSEVANALWSSCSWIKTPQRHNYWLRVYVHLAKGTPTEHALKKYIDITSKGYSDDPIAQNAFIDGALSESAREYWYEQFKNERDDR